MELEPDDLSTDSDAQLCSKNFNISVAMIETIVEPKGIADDFFEYSATPVSTHQLIMAILGEIICQ